MCILQAFTHAALQALLPVILIYDKQDFKNFEDIRGHRSFESSTVAMKARRLTRLDLIVLATVLLIGLLHLPYPFDGDQALFTIGASKISRGATLYRDFWDLKQPGIFGFYLLAGVLFGFTEVGVHALELIYLLIFSVVLLLTLRGFFESRAIASLVPLLTVGFYYGIVRSWHLTQVEGLAGFPLFLSLWLATDCAARGKARWLPLFLSGIVGGVVLLLKFVFLPLVFSFWLAAFLHAVLGKGEPRTRALLRIFGPAFAGMLVPLLFAFGYFARQETLLLLQYTFFEYPSRAVVELPGWRLGSLLKGLLWFAVSFTPLTALTFVWAAASLGGRRTLLELNQVFLNLALWLIVGFGVILMQRLSWWDYHFMLFFVPLGILGTKGLDILWAHLVRAWPALSTKKGLAGVFLAVALLFSHVFASLCSKGLVLAQNDFAYGSENRLGYYREISDMYRTALSETEFLSGPDALPGGIFVAGTPVYYHVSGREQAIASNGWMLELYLPEQWMQLTQQLAQAKPAYIFIGTEYAAMVPTRSPQTSRFILENYSILRTGGAGTWYLRKD